MVYTNQFHMPGAYHFDSSSSNQSTLSASLFRPPTSPSASSSVVNLARSTASFYGPGDANGPSTPTAVNAKRKRVRGGDTPRETTPLQDWAVSESADMGMSMGLSVDGAQMRYTLAGQIDAPGSGSAAAQQGVDEPSLEDSVYSDVDYRRALGSKRPHDDMDWSSRRSTSFRVGQPGSPGSAGWSSFALNALGGVVGKVWEFCKTGAFRGFHAGGGKGFDMQGAAGAIGAAAAAAAAGSSSPTPSTTIATGIRGRKTWGNDDDVTTLPNAYEMMTPGGNHFLPGGFPESDYMPYMADCHELPTTPENNARPTAKRRQVSQAGDELRRNWVIVTEKETDERSANMCATAVSGTSAVVSSRASMAPTRSSTPIRPHQQPRYAAATTSSGRRISVPVSRLGGGGSSGTPGSMKKRASLRAASPSTASFAPQRSPVAPSSPTFLSNSSRIPIATHAAGKVSNPFARSLGPAAVVSSSSSRPSSRQSNVGSPAQQHHHPRRRSQSIVSTASTSNLKRHTTRQGIDQDCGGVGVASEIGSVAASPRLDAEAQKLAARKRAAERQADARIDSFNAHLLAMIRQGKEALGTTVEVDVDGAGAGAAVEDGLWMDEDD